MQRAILVERLARRRIASSSEILAADALDVLAVSVMVDIGVLAPGVGRSAGRLGRWSRRCHRVCRRATGDWVRGQSLGAGCDRESCCARRALYHNVPRHFVELRLKSCTVTVLGPVCLDAHLMQAFKTISSRMTICVVVAGRNDADRRSGVSQQRVVGAVRATMMMDLVDVDMPNLRPDAGFNIRILVCVVAAEITTNFCSEGVVTHQHRQSRNWW